MAGLSHVVKASPSRGCFDSCLSIPQTFTAQLMFSPNIDDRLIAAIVESRYKSLRRGHTSRMVDWMHTSNLFYALVALLANVSYL